MERTASERERAFVELYQRHYGVALSYARRRTDEASARYVVAETFTVAWRRSAELELLDLPWLYRTAALALNNHERAGRRQQRTAGRLAAQPEQTVPDPAAGHVGSAQVAGALSALPSADRELLRMVAWEQLDAAGLATVLGCTSGTATVRLHRARRRLRAIQAAQEGAGGEPGGHSPGQPVAPRSVTTSGRPAHEHR